MYITTDENGVMSADKKIGFGKEAESSTERKREGEREMRRLDGGGQRRKLVG